MAKIKRWTKLALSLVFFGGATLARLIRLDRRPRLIILYYHSVRAKDRAAFARHLDAVRSGSDAVVPADFCGAVKPGKLLVAITFDDAFTSVLENALPELASRAMPSTIFAPAGALAQGPGWEIEEKYAEDRTEMVAAPEMLRAAAGDLVAIGAHGSTHVRLSRISRDAAFAEIAGSKEQLERLLGREVTLFAFPFGDFNDEVIDLCRKARFRHVFSTVPRVVNPRTAAFLRGRVSIELDDGPLEFWLKMSGAYCWMPGVSRLKARFDRRDAAAPREYSIEQKST